MSRQKQTSARRKTSGGQAIVMVTLALMAMAGMMGLAVDLGWSFFVKKQAQAAADGAAMAAAQEVYKRVGGKASQIACTGAATNADCQGPVPCSTFAAGSPSNLNNGCLYAAINGFTAGGQGGRQNVTIQAGITNPPPTAPGVTAVAYWVTVRTFQTIPQLFSSVLGNTSGTVAARATAGLAAEVVRGSFVGLNREGDCEEDYCGVDIHFNQSGGAITAAGDVILASQCHGSAAGCGTRSGSGASITPGNVFAGMGGNGTSVTAGVGSQVLVLGLGNVQNPNTYHPAPTLNQPDGAAFQDPTKGLTQPPVTAAGGNPNAGIQTCGILNGTINGGSGAGLTLGPYNYYSYHMTTGSNPQPVADGAQITVTGNVAFAASGSCPAGGKLGVGGVSPSGAAFPAYLFHGGLQVGTTSGSTNTNATFGPGQYVIDGAIQNGCGAGCKSFDVVDGGGNTNVYSSGSGSGYAGQMLIFTAPTGTNNVQYPGLQAQIDFMNSGSGAINGFSSLTATGCSGSACIMQGKNEVEIRNTGSSFTLNGINKDSGAVPAQLLDYNGTLTWWDRRNSVTKYNADGSYNCPAPYNNCNKTTAQWQADKMFDNYESPEMEIDGTSGHIHFNGVMYQPRGSFIEFQGSSPISMGVQVISGSMRMEGGASINLITPTTVFSRVFASLIE